MNLVFSKTEMQEYLTKLGYSCTQVEYTSEDIYEEEYVFDVAYINVPPQEYSDILNCRLEYVFNNELKKKLLSL